MNTSSSLEEVKYKRRMIWLWFPIGAVLFFLVLYPYTRFVGAAPIWLISSLNIAWAAIYVVLRIWSSRIECKRCGHVAVLPYWPARTECKKCGSPYRGKRGSGNQGVKPPR